MKIKKLLVLVIISLSTFIYSQVSIGKASITNSSVSLEFGIGNRGLLLPWVTSAANVVGAVDGTFIFDTNDRKVKYRNDGSWSDLSVELNGKVDVSLQSLLVELPSSKVVIGNISVSDTTPGILILSDIDKSMILPKVASPHLNIVNPSAGMIVYDTENHQLATFNGSVWSFWKPN